MCERRSPGVGNDFAQRLHLCGFSYRENYVKHELHVKWCCYHAISMLRECMQREKLYLYVRHSVVIEITACCESLAANGTFCEEHYELKKWTWYKVVKVLP